MSRYVIYLQYLLTIFPITALSLGLFSFFCPLAISSTLTPEKPVPIHDTLLSLTLLSPPIKYGKLTPYVGQPNDKIIIDNQKNRWVVRKYKKIGTLVGPKKAFLFHLSTSQPTGLKPLPTHGKQYKLTTNIVGGMQEVPILTIGFKNMPIDSVWSSKGLITQTKQTIYLRLKKPLHPNQTYSLTPPNSLWPKPLTFTYQPNIDVSPAIHINQVGFRSKSPAKIAFLSYWAGSLGAIQFSTQNHFELIDEANNNTVFSGPIIPRKLLSDRTEDAYGKNYTGANVSILDFSSFQRPGFYHLKIPGTGCSPSFVIRNNIWNRPLHSALRAFYHQRADITLGPPFTSFLRPHSIVDKTGGQYRKSNARLMDTGNGFLGNADNFSELIRQITSGKISGIKGGYHDAGDWDRRIQHLAVTRNLLDLYEKFPIFFNEFYLNIPESDNTLPDIIDEALWPLDFFSLLQNSEGAIRGGVEADGHPFYGEPSWLEHHTLLAYNNGIWSTYLFAATAAQAAKTLLPLDADRSARYKDKAIRAMHWAEKQLSKNPSQPFQIIDARNLAAIQLYALTRAPEWRQLFVKTSVFNRASNPLSRDEQYDQANSAWACAQLPATLFQTDINKNCKKAITDAADKLIENQKNAGFGWLKTPWRPPFGGAFTIPFTRDVIRAWLLSGDERYLKSVTLSVQFSFGANPQNLSYMTGIGTSPVQHPFYPDARISGQPAPAGITVLGPLDIDAVPEATRELKTAYGTSLYPRLETWPVLETFYDVFWYPQMNEFSIETMANQVYSLGFLAAYHTRNILSTTDKSL